MIDAIGASLFTSFLTNSVSNISRTRQVESASRSSDAENAKNTDSTGLRLSDETRQALVALQQNASQDVVNAKNTLEGNVKNTLQGENAPAVFSKLLVGNAYPIYTARGDLASSGTGMNDFTRSGLFAEKAVSTEKALAAYRRAGGETGVAPWGTGFSLEV